MNLASLTNYAKHKDGTYVALEMDEHSRDLLDNFAHMNLGLTERIAKDQYHCTIIYSRTPVPYAETLYRSTTAIGRAEGYDVFKTKDGGKCLVLRVNIPEAMYLNSLLNQNGATSDYDSYKPHVTLCYDYKGDEDVSKLPVPPFALSFDSLTVDPLDPLFVPKNN